MSCGAGDWSSVGTQTKRHGARPVFAGPFSFPKLTFLRHWNCEHRTKKANAYSGVHRTSLASFIAAQLIRTPRFFQSMCAFLDSEGVPYDHNDLRGAMLVLIDRWIPRLTRMNAVYAYNDTAVPLPTSDNPAVAWKKTGDHETPRHERVAHTFTTHVDRGTLPEAEVHRLNDLCLANAHSCVYSSNNDTAGGRERRVAGATQPMTS